MVALLPVAQRPAALAQLAQRRSTALLHRCVLRRVELPRQAQLAASRQTAGRCYAAALGQGAVKYVPADEGAFSDALHDAGAGLVVVEVWSPHHCESGLLSVDQEPLATKDVCANFRREFEDVASEVPHVKFLSVEVDHHTHPMCEALGVDILPSVMFFRAGAQVWMHKGYYNLAQEMGEGILYYGDAAAGGEQASNSVAQLATKQDLQAFVNAHPPEVLAVVDVSTELCEPCVHIYPAVLGLAKSFRGFASFARLMGEEDGVYEKLMEELRIETMPTFLFYRNGQEVGRYVGDSRGLIMEILATQQKAGIPPPPPPGRQQAATGGRRKMTRNAWGKKHQERYQRQ